MMALSALLLLTSTTLVASQRPFFAGTRPIGYPDIPNRATTETLVNRFGDGTTEKLPIEANGDRDLVDRLSKLPIDKQPFWFINWQALEEHRNKPQTYPQKPNVFIDPTSNVGSSNAASNMGSTFSGFSNSGSVNSNSGSSSSGFVASNTRAPNSNNENRNMNSDSGLDSFNSQVPNSNNGNTNIDRQTNSGSSASVNRNSETLDDRFETEKPNSGDPYCSCGNSKSNHGFVKADVDHDKNIRDQESSNDNTKLDSANKSVAQYVSNTQKTPQVQKLSDYDSDGDGYYRQARPYLIRRIILLH